jgi:hypothetical protein
MPGEMDGYLYSKLLEDEKLHPASYRGLGNAKKELQKKKTQRINTTTERVCASNLTTPGVSATALRGSTAKQQEPQARQIPWTILSL